MQKVYNLYPDNDNRVPIPPYRFNWLECFLVVACVALTITVVYQGITSLAMILAGLS